MATAKALKTFHDAKLNAFVHVGTVFERDDERMAELAAKLPGYLEQVEAEPKQPKQPKRRRTRAKKGA